MKLNNYAIMLLLILVMLCGCTHEPEGMIVLETEEPISTFDHDSIKERISSRSEEIGAMYYDIYLASEKTEPKDRWSEVLLPQSSIDAIENRLMEAEIDVLDSTEKYPSYLPLPEKLYAFLDAVQAGDPAEYEVVAIENSGSLAYRLFVNNESGLFIHLITYNFESAECCNYELHEVLDWELTEKKNFFYRIYPAGDKHYADYMLIRTTPPDTDLWDLTFQYIYPAEYTGTNIFLIDWEEGNWGELSFNDVWEYLYYYNEGDQYCSILESFAWEDGFYNVPASIFEETILPYFNIEAGDLQNMAQYNSEFDSYPWRQIETNDFVFLYYYTCEPQVVAYKSNPDGTITLTVEMLSTDLKLDCLFAHEVTVRPLSDSTFQYVGNKVTFQTEYGLPFCEPRLTWN